MSAPRLLSCFINSSRLPYPCARNFCTSTSSNFTVQHSRKFSLATVFKMPEKLTSEEVNSQTDPSVSKQFDNETEKVKQVQEFFSMADEHKFCLLNTYRNGVGPVGRSMAIARRDGPDFLFLANKHSRKISDMEQNKEVQITFHDSKTQDWGSVSGTAATVSNDDSRIKELWNKEVKAWFGDLKDGKHDGSADDPRMTLIEVKPKYVTYWLHQKGSAGFAKEVGMAAMTGKVATTGVLRELSDKDLEQARNMM